MCTVTASHLVKITGCEFSATNNNYNYQYGNSYDTLRLRCTGPDDYGNYRFDSCYDTIFRYQQMLSDMKFLQTGDCGGIQLDQRIRVFFTNLQTFDISSYGVESLSSADLNLKHLETFKAPYNQLTNISSALFIHTPQISEIDFSYNQINAIHSDDFKGASKLTKILFPHNDISILESELFMHTPKLMSIDLSYNKITKLEIDTFSTLKYLQTLDLRNNLIKIIDRDAFKNNNNLQRLFFENNPIQRFDCNISSLANFRIGASLSWNNITELDTACGAKPVEFTGSGDNVILTFSSLAPMTIKKEYFKNFRLFNTSGNHLKNTAQLIDLLGPSIEVLDVSSNYVGELSANTTEQFTNLKYFSLRNTNLSVINADVLSKTSSKLETLLLENNPFIRMHCDFFSFLMNSTAIHVSDDMWNHIEELDTSCLKDSLQIELKNGGDVLFRVLIVNAGIERHCDRKMFENLRFLNISGNHVGNAVKIIELLGESIETLDLSGNFVGKLNSSLFERFNRLHYLDLSHTNLSNFGFGTFYHQRKLTHLDVSFNHMKHLNFTLFLRNFKDLKTLHLEGNDLSEINTVTRAIFPQLSTLGISKNRFSCDYLATFLLQWPHIHLMNNPTPKQMHIDGVDCYHDEHDLIDKEIVPNHTENIEFDKNHSKVGSTVRFDCNIFSPKSQSAPILCEQLEEIDTSCFGKSLEIELNSDVEIVLHVREKQFELRCSKENVKKLNYFNITGNHLQNTQNVIAFFDSSIETLDVSLNFIGQLNAQTFKKLNNLKQLNLSHTNLSNFEFTTFYYQSQLKMLDLSFNHLKKVNFTLLFRNFRNLDTLNLEGNDLFEVDSVTRANFPKLSFLGLSKNNFSCDYLAVFLRQWENLKLFKNHPSDQTHIDGVDCYAEKHESTGKIAIDNVTKRVQLTTAETTAAISTASTKKVRLTTTKKPIQTTETIEIANLTDITTDSESSSDEYFDTSTEIQNSNENTEHWTTEATKSTIIETEPKFNADFSTERIKRGNGENFSNQLVSPRSDSPLSVTEVRVFEFLLLICIVYCGYKILKSKNVQRIQQRTILSLGRMLANREDAQSSQHNIELIENGQ